MTLVNIIFLIVSFLVVAYFLTCLARIWRTLNVVGKGIEENRLDQLTHRFSNTMWGGLVQKKMFKDPIAGFMHAIIFWGFLVLSLGTLETLAHGVYTPFNMTYLLGSNYLYKTFLFSQDSANFLVLLAIIFAFSRRLFFPPKRFTTLTKSSKIDAYIVLALIGLLVLTSLLTVGSASYFEKGLVNNDFIPFSRFLVVSFKHLSLEIIKVLYQVFWYFHVLVLFSFMIFLPHSKHQHFIWVWPNLFFKSLKSSGRIRPMVFDEEAESFGVGKVADFTWKQLLDGITCVECGRCSSVCPATTTGKSLDPRSIIHYLKDGFNKSMAGSEPKLIDGLVTREELWACTTCGACMEACPLDIEHIPSILDMRRFMVMTEGQVPKELQGTLENLEAQSNPWGFNNDTRADWAKGLDVPLLSSGQEVEYLFWVGCAGSFDDRYKKVSRSLVKIFQQAGLKYGILGKEEKCNGDTARRSGNEYLANMQIEENIQTLERYKVKKVITACPHCFNTIKNEYPDFGYKPEVIHHSEIIQDLISKKLIQTSDAIEDLSKVTYHDSCYLGRHNDVYESPRKTLQALGKKNLVEMKRSKEKGFCCGAGGARMWMEETEGERINVNRTKEAIETGAKTIATACPFCLTMLSDGVKSESKEKEVEVKDIAEIVSENIVVT
ncbi:MAG: Fe-S oxidoreductase [Zetaproteobacteria bacterium]|nr:Fe-S oxidoreductase [Pseudobdellovibrionaceae bacterium]|tara:strand:- start:72 stop:2060 length:1989 start_codon:yes stop_codon:yes gene_type:complete